jgi:phospholipase C
MTTTGNRRATMRRWRGRTWTLLAGMLLVAAGCATGQGPVGTTPTSPPTTAARGAPSTGRIIVVVEENHSFDQVIGAPQARC